jgi:hypothetical protein
MYPPSFPPFRQLKILQSHVAKTGLHLAITSHTLSSLVVAASNRLTTLGTYRLNHRTSTLTNSERVAITAAVPVSSSPELTGHGIDHVFHLFIGDEAVESALAQHLFDFINFVSYSTSLGMFSAEGTGLLEVLSGLDTECSSCVVITVVSVSLLCILPVESFNIPLLVL